jgi:hypothetical protein
MDLTHRACSGSKRARRFYLEQQRLWSWLFLEYSPDVHFNDAVLQLFQGAVLTFLITKDRTMGIRALAELFKTRPDLKRGRR